MLASLYPFGDQIVRNSIDISYKITPIALLISADDCSFHWVMPRMCGKKVWDNYLGVIEYVLHVPTGPVSKIRNSKAVSVYFLN